MEYDHDIYYSDYNGNLLDQRLTLNVYTYLIN